MYSYQLFGNWCFRFILSQSFEASQSYSLAFLRYWLLSFKFLFCFTKSQLWQHRPIIKIIWKLWPKHSGGGKKKKRGKILTRGKKLRATYEKALGSSHWGKCSVCWHFFFSFWHLWFKEERVKKEKARKGGRMMAHGISKERLLPRTSALASLTSESLSEQPRCGWRQGSKRNDT